jgi:two-component system, NtrC family, sensor kinase
MESIGKLAGGVAHEINTPLGIILGYAQLLKEDAPPDSQLAEDLAIIEKQTKVCRKIVADLLGFSRQGQTDKREMCFNNSVMESVSLVRHSFELDRVHIVTRLDDSFPIIYGDPEKLKQVWINLLNNAKDAMPESGGVIVVVTKLMTPSGHRQAQCRGQRHGHRRGVPEEDFRSVLHHQAGGQGHGAGAVGVVRHRQGPHGRDPGQTARCRPILSFPPCRRAR